jgi:hypothetical protein
VQSSTDVFPTFTYSSDTKEAKVIFGTKFAKSQLKRLQRHLKRSGHVDTIACNSQERTIEATLKNPTRFKEFVRAVFSAIENVVGSNARNNLRLRTFEPQAGLLVATASAPRQAPVNRSLATREYRQRMRRAR